jgi:hypothetical protein
MAKKNRSNRNRNRNRKTRKNMKGGDANAPAVNASAPAPAANNVTSGKLMGGKRKSRKLSPGAQAWRTHVMSTFKELRAKDRNATFSQALKTAGKTYRK